MSLKDLLLNLALPMLLASLLCIFLLNKKTIIVSLDGQCLSGDCINGYGFFIWHTGAYYIGNWENASQNGYGALYWQNGQKYLGYWEKGTMQGHGQLINTNGNSKWGVWNKNLMIKDLALEQMNTAIENNKEEFAKIQWQNMLKDRAKMLELQPILQDSMIIKWVLAELAGRSLGNSIYWQKEADLDFQIIEGFRAVHRWPSSTHSAAIWVSENLEAEEMWACFIFELFNICNATEFEKINKDVEKGICRTEEEYIHRFSALEHKAILKTQDFYTNIWLPKMQAAQIQSNENFWFMMVSKDFDTWINSYTQRDGYPWQPYTVFYKQQLQNMLKKY